MQKIYAKISLAILSLVISIAGFGQAVITNYTYTPGNNNSLTDMSTGTTQIVAPSSDDVASAVTNIGFDFWLMGVKYTQFSASSNGYLRLGGTAVTTATYTLGGAATLISTLGSDNQIHSTGKVHYKVIGTAPNRVLVVEFKNTSMIYDEAIFSPDATSQIRLYETTDQVELVYGSVNRNAGDGFGGSMDPVFIGFSTSATVYATVKSSTDVLSTSGAISSNQYTLGAPVAELTSAADGSRKFYSFVPQPPNTPSGLNFTSVTQTAMTLNWTDNAADELGYMVYISSDGGTTYNLLAQTVANVVTYNAIGLSPSTNYFFKIAPIREHISTNTLNGSQITLG